MTRAAISPATPAVSRTTLTANPTYQAYEVLHIGFAVLPIVAGVDKFFHFLANWDMYLAPFVTRTLHIEAHPFMLIVGVIEVLAGILVACWPRLGGYVVMLWLWGIIVNLFMFPGFFDIALRDFGLSLGALALARLSENFGRPIR